MDCPTDFGGVLTDSLTVGRAEILGIDILRILNGHDAYSALTALRDGLVTGNTGTNVCSLNRVSIA